MGGCRWYGSLLAISWGVEKGVAARGRMRGVIEKRAWKLVVLLPLLAFRGLELSFRGQKREEAEEVLDQNDDGYVLEFEVDRIEVTRLRIIIF